MYIYIHIYRFELADVPPPPAPRNEKVGTQVNVTFLFWQMYPPPRMEISEISD